MNRLGPNYLESLRAKNFHRVALALEQIEGLLIRLRARGNEQLAEQLAQHITTVETERAHVVQYYEEQVIPQLQHGWAHRVQQECCIGGPQL